MLKVAPLLIGGVIGFNSEVWHVGVKLVEAEESLVHDLPGLQLVAQFWGACRWATVIVGTEAGLRRGGFTKETLRTVRRCARFSCRFVEHQVFEKMTGLKWEVQNYGITEGYFVGEAWRDFSSSEEAAHCADKASFRFIEHPLRQLFQDPDFFPQWLAARVTEKARTEKALARRNARSPEELEELSIQALSEICTDSVEDYWGALWPGTSTARRMIIIGCNDLLSEPTKPLLEKGTGGLFVDIDKRAISKALAGPHATPNRRILNTTASVQTLSSLLEMHAEFVKDVDVVQVDIDTVDGPVLMRLLELTTPQAVVVEVRSHVPFPFRYAGLAQDTKGLPWGGATLAYWLHELGLRGFLLVRMDSRDAVFARRDIVPRPDPLQHYLATLGCYFRNHLLGITPVNLINGLHDGEPDRWRLFWHHWIRASPEEVFSHVWQNLTSWRQDIPFSLQL